MLTPINTIQLLSKNGVIDLLPSQITPECIGEKAYGLSCIPNVWTVPYFVISQDLYSYYRHQKSLGHDVKFNDWLHQLLQLSNKLHFSKDEQILVRSSARSENIHARGKYLSEPGKFSDLDSILLNCCIQLFNDEDIKDSTVFFVVQKHVLPVRSKGHLSNERRLSKEHRDWVFETEAVSTEQQSRENIAIRTWREGKYSELAQLKCTLKLNLPQALRAVAKWTYKQHLRIHYEWVWDGSNVYLVQADIETAISGENPELLIYTPKKNNTKFAPSLLRETNEIDATIFRKIKNVAIYKKLNFSTVKLYILNDINVFKNIMDMGPLEELSADFEFLVSDRPLIIRTDLAQNAERDLAAMQMLPRTDGISTVSEAIEFIRSSLQDFKNKNIPLNEIAFLAHNYIPSTTSAWSYAEPKHRKVLIESLWGIPEGLYYYAHDQFIVDTLHINPADFINNEEKKFSLSKDIRHKSYFVSPDQNGKWITRQVAEPYDWRPTIKSEDWLKDIAKKSRLIAEEVGHPVNIMWFVGIPKECQMSSCIPW